MRDLPADEVHLWETSLSVDDAELARILDLLSPVDRWAADEFSHVPARKQYIVSRGMLRQLLSGYIGVPRSEERRVGKECRSSRVRCRRRRTTATRRACAWC